VFTPGVFRIGSYTAASFGATALNAARGIIVARVLGPTDYGLWSVLTLVLVWSQFSDLGLLQAANRQIPILLEVPDRRGHSRTVFDLFLGKIGSAAIVAVGVSIFALAAGLTAVYREGLLVVAFLVVLLAVQQFGSVVLLAQSRVRAASIVVIVTAVANLALSAGCALVWGLRGIWYSQLVLLLATAVMYLMLIQVIPTKPDMRRLLALLKIGLPLGVLAVLSFNLVNIDQIVIASLLGTRDLAYYFVGLTAGSLLYVFPSAIAAVIGPRLMRHWAVGGDVAEFAWVPVRFLSDSYLVAVAAVWLMLPWAIHVLLPRYGPGVAPARIYLTGTFFLGINMGASSYMLALRKNWLNVPNVAAAIGTSVAAEVTLVHFGYGLEGVALGSALGYVVYGTLHLTLVRKMLGDQPAEAVRNAWLVLWPGLLLASLSLAALWLNRLAEIALPIAVVIYSAWSLRRRWHLYVSLIRQL
jgi:O-antigen/teichoic acid export membrane protein